MTLKPIPGAPVGAAIPDFPVGAPGPLGVARDPVAPAPEPPPAPARRPGPIELRGADGSVLVFHAKPEIPAITRASMTVSVKGEPPRLDLATDEARTFLSALRAGSAPVVAADSRSGFQIEFVVADDGPTFIIGKQGPTRRFTSGDVSTMAAHLLADLGP